MAYLYRHIRLDTSEPFYIGIGSDNNFTRAYTNRNRNKYWKNIIKKTPYEVEILLNNLTWEEACAKEKEFITLYGRKDLKTGLLCNLTNGGEGVLGLICSNESRLKMRNSQLGKKQSIEQIEKRAAKLRGSGNYWYGKKFSDQYKKKLSDAKKGKKRDPEVMKKLHQVNSKKVINIQTNEEFSSIRVAALSIGISVSTMSRWVKKCKQYKLVNYADI